MIRVLTIIGSLGTAALFARFVSITDLLPALQPMLVALSIVTAAVLVRLNRGMPTLDWKALKVDERKNITSSILAITREYLIILSLFSTAMVTIIATIIVGKDKIIALKHASSVVTSFIAFLCAVCAMRMAYVAWRDYDIVRLQKMLIDKSGEREEQEAAAKLGDEKIVAMRAAGLRPSPIDPPKAWLS